MDKQKIEEVNKEIREILSKNGLVFEILHTINVVPINAQEIVDNQSVMQKSDLDNLID